MKKVALIAIILFTVNMYSFGQSVEKENKSYVIPHDDDNAFLINVGVGKSDIEHLYVPFSIEYFANNDISVAVSMLMGFNTETANNWEYSIFNYSTGLNLNYHLNTLFNLSYKWDLYLGANGGYNINTVTPKDWNAPAFNSDDNRLYGGGQIGIRYYITPVLGINAEGTLGTFRNGASLGISLHF